MTDSIKTANPNRKNTLALDLDGVLCDFVTGAIELAKSLGRGSEVPDCADDVCNWQFFPQDLFDDMDDAFWHNLNPLRGAVDDANRLAEDYELKYYLTSRPCSGSTTYTWLLRHGFPDVKVITVKESRNKLQYLIDHPVDIYVDDLHTTIEDCVSNGINAVMYPSPYHRELVPHNLPCINSLSDLFIGKKEDKRKKDSESIRTSPCQEAYRLVHGNRGEDYGHPAADFERTGKLWAIVLQEWAVKTGGNQPIPPHLVSLCMVQLKISRELNKHKEDNLIDGAGYFETTQMVWDYYKQIQDSIKR